MEYTEEWLEAVRRSFNLAPKNTNWVTEYTPGQSNNWPEPEYWKSIKLDMPIKTGDDFNALLNKYLFN